MLDNYVGQRDRLEPLLVAMMAAKARSTRLPNMLFLGPPGTGKTTLAGEVAEEMGLPFAKLYAQSAIEREQIGDKVMEADGGILFIDEIHRLPPQLCENLYTVIDEGVVTVNRPMYKVVETPTYVHRYDEVPENLKHEWEILGPGMYPISRSVPTRGTQPSREKINSITIIGATTDEALLPAPFLSRLSSLIVRLRPYTIEELMEIAIDHATNLGMAMEDSAAEVVAARSQQTPRIVKHLVERSKDYAVAEDRASIFPVDSLKAVEGLGIDAYGLNDQHRRILTILAETGGLSRTSLAQRMNLRPINMELYWGTLMQLGFVTIGRKHEITEKGMGVLNA